MVSDYRGALRFLASHPESSLDEAVRAYASNLRWDDSLKAKLKQKKTTVSSAQHVRPVYYRPFVKQYCYVDYVLITRKSQQDSIFPTPDADNRMICAPGVGSTQPFSVLMVDGMSDLHFNAFGQCFPRYRYAPTDDPQPTLLPKLQASVRLDNIRDQALTLFRENYKDDGITKDAIFDYLYGLLHAPLYGQRFADDLTKQIPRLPMARSFDAFGHAGSQLAALHLGYETCDEYPLDVVPTQSGELLARHFRFGERPMRFAHGDKSVLVVNEHVRLAGIPQEAHAYVVNGRTPLEWFIDRYRVTRDRHSGIVNDPNGWFSTPEDLISAIRRVVHVSVETVRIVAGLPEPFAE